MFKRKVVLVTYVVLIMLMLPVQACTAYSTSQSTAESKPPGIYNEHLNTGDESAYYKIYCYNSAIIYVNIAFNYPSDLLYLQIRYQFNSTNSANSAAFQNASMICNDTGFYYWRINDAKTGLGDVDFELNITIVGEWALDAPATPQPQVPGFEALIITCTLIVLIALSLILRQIPVKSPLKNSS
ncbi:MAG: hypothetical protein EAX96_05735 [Candidatus Lokiarchaeota archaeon]|nr:hypothetical protein [Candidatus Lokiarchaeota archaeon]